MIIVLWLNCLGYEDAIVVPEITTDNFELKHGLLTLVQNKQFLGHDKEDPHAHIRYFNKITSTMKFSNVPSTSAWDRFNDLLLACPYHGFSELHQLDTFYNALNSNDQDSLNSAAGVRNSLEKEVVELKKDPLHTQVTTLVDEHLDTRLGETREEFMNFLSESLTARIKELQILPKEVSNFAPPVIEALIKESRDEVTLANVSFQPHSTYEAASTLTEFELKKIPIDKMEKSESYLAAPEHRDCYDSLKKS
ncbi:hypothetical protein Tco_0736218 [Tanacetum coccineum]